ncbi:hypothetical protein M5D96_010817 [Drosophila gunungcola]|uniref:Uncharacterized protein n=1 Tax=Drosophila gunungcola TaxID=103775 RepID=A0A9P9YGQ6_9MUSC|nr:hypothetical protein M5D96_010817 [Drosophila gunungcola]
MAAEDLAGSGSGQGRSEDRPVVRPPRTPRRTPRNRRRSEASSPEPTVSSDSDVDMVDDPTVEARTWRLRNAAGPKGNIPHGSERRVHQDSAAGDHAAEARRTAAVIAEYRRRHERRQQEALKEARQREEQDARAKWEATLKTAEEEERRIWGDPILLEEVPPQAEGTPEVPPTPRYIAEPRESAADPTEEEYNPPSPPTWTPARPPTPSYWPEWEEAEQEEEQRQQEGSPGYVRMDIPVAHVSHTLSSLEAEGRVWRQHTVTWTWPDEAIEATDEEGTRVWEEPRGNCRDPRLWRTAVPRAPTGVVMPTPTPTPSPLASPEVVAAQQERVEQVGLPAEEVVEKGPLVWPDPVAPPRPSLKRQYSAPVAETRPAFVRQGSAPDSRRWREVVEVDWPEGIAEAPAVIAARRRGGKRCVLVQQGGRTFRVRVEPVGVRVFTQ